MRVKTQIRRETEWELVNIQENDNFYTKYFVFDPKKSLFITFSTNRNMFVYKSISDPSKAELKKK